VGCQSSRQRFGADRRNLCGTRRDRARVQEGLRGTRAGGADGHGVAVLSSGFPRWRFHLERPGSTRLRAAEDDARDGPWSACRRADEAIKHLREAVNYLCEYNMDRKYGFKLALESKPNEPRGDIYMATTGHYLGFIATLDHPEMVGVNPEVAHEQMAGLNFLHGVAQAWEAGKLFHIDLNDQMPGRFDQDLRFGSVNIKAAFWLVKFLEDVGYAGPRHFDAHAYRTEDYEGVKDFARGCMRNYLIFKEKAEEWNADDEIRAILKELSANSNGAPRVGNYSNQGAAALLAHSFDKEGIMRKRLPYERLDQLTIDILTGVR
jgi:xylose isomerase